MTQPEAHPLDHISIISCTRACLSDIFFRAYCLLDADEVDPPLALTHIYLIRTRLDKTVEAPVLQVY